MSFASWFIIVILLCGIWWVGYRLSLSPTNQKIKPVYDYRTVQTRIFVKEYKTSFGVDRTYTAQVYNGYFWENLEPFGGRKLTWKRARELYPNDPCELGQQKAKIDFFLRQLERQESTVLMYGIEHPIKPQTQEK